MSGIKVDLCVIGAGSGGLSVASGAAQMGASVVLIEGGRMGGDCLNYGCVPSKALLAAAAAAHAMRGGFGVAGVPPQVDFAAAKDHVAAVIATIAPVDSQERFEGLGVQVIRAWARFTSPTEVAAGNIRITARRFVIATGSVPLVPAIAGLADVPHLTNETIFDLRDAPEHLIVIGGGPIGVEMAQAHRRLGCRVTVIEGGRMLAKDDPELAAVVVQSLRAEGVEIVEGAEVAAVRTKDGMLHVDLKDAFTITGSHLLIATGRKPALDRLDLAKAEVAFDKKGLVLGQGLRSTTNRRVYGVGDIAGRQQFTHVAGYHAGVVIRQIMFGLPATARDHHIPWVTYTDPELAQVGLTETAAREKFGARLTVLRVPFAENDRAVTAGKIGGLMKVMVAAGRPVGVSIVGAQAGELIGFWALAMAARLRMSQVAATVLPYPTLNELSKRAAGAYFSPKLFDSPSVRRVVRFVQNALP